MVEDSRALIERIVSILERASRSLQKLAEETAALKARKDVPQNGSEAEIIVLPRRIP